MPYQIIPNLLFLTHNTEPQTMYPPRPTIPSTDPLKIYESVKNEHALGERIEYDACVHQDCIFSSKLEALSSAREIM